MPSVGRGGSYFKGKSVVSDDGHPCYNRPMIRAIPPSPSHSFFIAIVVILSAAGCTGPVMMVAPVPSVDFSIPTVAAPGSRAQGEGARRIFRGAPAEVESVIAAEWGKVSELTVRREAGALIAEQKGSGFAMTMTARFAAAGEGKTEVELLIALSYTLALDRLQEMESKHLEKLAADTGR